MTIQSLIQSEKFKWMALGIIFVIAMLVAYQLGVFVGASKARFSYQWADQYEKNFGGARGGMMREFGRTGFRNSHGTIGEIISIADSGLVIKDQEGEENFVTLDDDTLVKQARDTVSFETLKVGNMVAVIGSPRADGAIGAKIIRVFDKDTPLPFGPMIKRFER